MSDAMMHRDVDAMHVDSQYKVLSNNEDNTEKQLNRINQLIATSLSDICRSNLSFENFITINGQLNLKIDTDESHTVYIDEKILYFLDYGDGPSDSNNQQDIFVPYDSKNQQDIYSKPLA